jgi:hypothetical protein
MGKSVFFLSFLFVSTTWAANFTCLSLDDGKTRGCARSEGNDKSCGGASNFAFWEGSCFFNEGEAPIAEILKLGPKEVIPDSVYNKYDMKKVAKTVVYRLYLDEKKSITDSSYKNPSYDVYKNSEIQMAFDLQNLANIAKSGFLNQFQTGTSNGTLSSRYRLAAEATLTNVTFDSNFDDSKDNRIHFLRPKYAYFVPMNASSVFQSQVYIAGYGGVFAVMKDEVKNRATFTSKDSLAAYDGSTRADIHTYKFMERRSYPRTSEAYYEAQVFGPLTLSDVKYLMINCPGQAGVNIEALTRILKTAAPDFPVFSCKDNAFRAYMPDKLLYGKPNADFAPNYITKLQANFSGGDIKSQISDSCDGSSSCEFDVSRLKLPDPAVQTLKISYSCSKNPNGPSYSVSIDSDAKNAHVTLSCGSAPAASYKTIGKVKVISAFFGKNVVGAGKSDVTEKAAAFCDGKEECEYKVSPRFIGDPAPDKEKDFEIVYRCSSKGAAKREYVKADSVDKVLKLTCN